MFAFQIYRTNPVLLSLADHVFEVQLVIKFFRWLGGLSHTNPLPMRIGWQAASAAWVEGYVMGLPDSPIAGFIVGGLGSCLDIISDNFVGSVQNTDPLALLFKDINGSKGRWLSGAVDIAASGSNLKQIVYTIREVLPSPLF